MEVPVEKIVEKQVPVYVDRYTYMYVLIYVYVCMYVCMCKRYKRLSKNNFRFIFTVYIMQPIDVHTHAYTNTYNHRYVNTNVKTL